VVSGLVLSFSRALGEFGATLMVAGSIPGKTQTIPLAIYFAVDSGDAATANTLVAIVTVFSFAVIYLLNLWLKKRNYSEKTKVS
jgi:molybdate transport system permease protein